MTPGILILYLLDFRASPACGAEIRIEDAESRMQRFLRTELTRTLRRQEVYCPNNGI